MNTSFNTGDPIAYLIIWTTYGTWLPGDDRGWNRLGDEAGLPANRFLNEVNRRVLKESPFLLSGADRQIVEDTIRRHCEIRDWMLHAVNARSNHVHMVVAAPNYSPETVRDQFKAWCTRQLKPCHPDRKRFWTEGSSNRWINLNNDLETAIVYVLDIQDKKRDREQIN